MLDRGMSLNKNFKENKMTFLDQASITEKKYYQNTSLSEKQNWSGRNPKLTELAEGFYFITNINKQ